MQRTVEDPHPLTRSLIVLGAAFALTVGATAQEKIRVTNLDELPRHTYQLPGTASELSTRTSLSASGAVGSSAEAADGFSWTASVAITTRMPPSMQNTAVFSHSGTTGSSCVIMAQGIPPKIATNSPRANAIDPICLMIFIIVLSLR